ncbi:hypothetical protein ACIBI9_06940 [Nonomuraea sp. NPDC050451]|uniref:hypothetical protein n=1 Tax=Nonomuraea sp. NPDC050451 TaxID=3364364 RepID=UPI0037B78459
MSRSTERDQPAARSVSADARPGPAPLGPPPLGPPPLGASVLGASVLGASANKSAAQRLEERREQIAADLDRLTAAVRGLEEHAPTPRRSAQARKHLAEIKRLEAELRRQPGRHPLAAVLAPKDTPSAKLLAKTSSLRSRVEAIISPVPGSRPESERQPVRGETKPLQGPESRAASATVPTATGPAETGPAVETVLSVGRQSAGGVTVKETVLGERTRKVDIRGSCGVVVGSGNRQHNHFHYQLADRPLSLAKVLNATPAHKRALANLIENPASARANHAMRSLLGKEAAKVMARDDAVTARSVPKRVRLSGVLGPGGEIVVRGSAGVVVGRGNVQNNHFHYRIERPDALLARALAENAGAMRAIGEMYRDPAGRMADRDLGAMLTKLVTAKRPAADVVQAHGGRTERVPDGRGVMIGSDNVRIDEVHSPSRSGWRALLRSALDQNVPASADTRPSVDSEAGQSRQSPSSLNLSRDRW